jgi:hypothetical protein
VSNSNNTYIAELKNASNAGQLTLYLGAGVSQASGLPSWEELIVSLYYQTLKDDELEYSLMAFPNYLYAIAEWRLQRSKEPLDVIVRRCKGMYQNDRVAFLRNLRIILYRSLGMDEYNFEGFTIDLAQQTTLLQKNSTLQAIIDLCKSSVPGTKGVRSIISYNYDNLLETGLKGNKECASIWKETQTAKLSEIPIYHVHGYLPVETAEIKEEEIILSEQQYNMMSQNAFYWGNMIQMNQLSTNSGLMIGVSLTDKNMRRILDAVQKIPRQNSNYIILREPEPVNLTADSEEIKKIDDKAREYMEKFVGSNIKDENKGPGQIIDILQKIDNFDKDAYKNDFDGLGLKVIWIKDFKEIPVILNTISG